MNAFGMPVALFFFNRPQKLAQVFEQVKKIRPAKLFLIQDGARPNHPEDSEKILECRQVVGQIDWACGCFRLDAEANGYRLVKLLEPGEPLSHWDCRSLTHLLSVMVPLFHHYPRLYLRWGSVVKRMILK
ncbi:MAG UNVERIFIED_CONTAM: hypothetical protein LVT10_13560 [Anaerolineae bacterium]|jgi:hypothetical protein